MRIAMKFNEDGTFTSETLDSLRSVVEEVMEGKTTLVDAIGINPEQFEGLYAVAYNTYASGKYNDAAKLFGVLVALQPYDVRIFMGLAASLQMMHNFENAAFFYQWACGLDQQDPMPMMHSAECYLASKDITSAKSALKYALQRAGDKPAHAALRSKVEVMLANLSE